MSELFHIVTKNLFLVDLPQKREGFRRFISSWAVLLKGNTILVDPGPASTIDLLISQLTANGISKIDSVLLTHLHIDHAGGIGKLIQHFPSIKVYIHPKGAAHLINTSIINRASEETLGSELFTMYGPFQNVNASNICAYDASIDDFSVIETPGHAPHHLSYCIDEYLFCGEALGVIIKEKNFLYMRPATPPKFISDIYIESINRLSNIECEYFCFGHFGALNRNFVAMSELTSMAKTQVVLWMQEVQKYPDNELHNSTELFKTLGKADPLFSHLHSLPEDIQKRELIFIKNSINGIRAA
jgi:glyoxylase-like metal-dependent hydrolase (beta-lactamase superfamily II)